MDIVANDGGCDNSEEREYIQPVALLMDELKNEDTAVRVESMKRLRTIALALGPERTRNELLPFLQNSLDEEDEVLAALSEEIGEILEHIGGPAFSHLLLPLLEGLVSAEEPFVREKAMSAFQGVIGVIPAGRLTESVLPSIQTLAEGDWFSEKNSAAALIVSVMDRLTKDPSALDPAAKQSLTTDLLRMFSTLASDESPLVRKAVASNLVKLLEHVDAATCARDLLPIVFQMAADIQDSVRSLAVEPLAVVLAKNLPESEKTVLLHSLVVSLAGDQSWRIRLMVARYYGSLVGAIHKSPSLPVDAIGIYCTLLQDVEPEVRSAASSQLSVVAKVFTEEEETDEHIVNALSLLVTDPSPHVRAAIALQLNDLAQVIGKKATIQVLPLLLQLLRDESSEVRLNVISKLEVIVDVIGIDQLSASLLPAIVNLTEDHQWRVRQTIIEYFPELAAHLGQEFFNERLSPMVLSWLEDAVFAVRETAVDSIKRLIRNFGSGWAVGSGLMEQMLKLKDHRNYLRRQTLLFALAATCSVVDRSVVETVYLPVLGQLAADPISNVRFNVAKTIEAIVPVLLASPNPAPSPSPAPSATPNTDLKDSAARDIILNAIVPILQQLQRDADVDVQEFSTRALNIIPAFQ